MGRLRRPELPPGALADLVRELHALHGRAGRPSMRTLAKGQRFSYTAVHDLFTRTVAEPPRLPVLITVVEQLASMAPRMDVEETLDRFDALWRAADAEPFDEPFEEPVEESTTAATSPEEVSPGAEPATSVAAAEREPAEPGAGKQTVLEQTAPHRPSEHTRPEQEETPLEHDAAGRERTARLEPAPARTAASARIDDDGGGRAVVDPRADAPAVLVDDGTAVGAVPQRLPATSALAEVILDKPIWIRTADGNLYPAPMHPAYGLSWGYPGGGPSALALLIHRLLDDITAPPVEYPGDAPGGLDELTERPWPCGTVLPRPLLEAARDGRPYDHP